MSDNGNVLTGGMLKALPALLTCPSIREAAEQAGLSERTVHRYLADSDFVAELRRQQAALLAAATATLVGATSDVLEELHRIATDGDRDSVRVQAIRIWLDRTLDAIELQELVERVEKLEERIGQ